jgi:hypothetical protein
VAGGGAEHLDERLAAAVGRAVVAEERLDRGRHPGVGLRLGDRPRIDERLDGRRRGVLGGDVQEEQRLEEVAWDGSGPNSFVNRARTSSTGFVPIISSRSRSASSKRAGFTSRS